MEDARGALDQGLINGSGHPGIINMLTADNRGRMAEGKLVV